MRYSVETIGLTKEFHIMGRRPLVSATNWGAWISNLGRFFKQVGRPKGNEILVALDHVDLKIKPGTIFGILGPNGAGKTTLIKLLSGLMTPDEGTAIVNGFDVVRQTDEVRKSVALVVMSSAGFERFLTGRENLEFYALMYDLTESEAKRKVRDVITLVGLDERADDWFGRYSSGMSQRLSIARGLLVDAPIFLMDEPTAMLDPVAAREIRRFVREELVQRLHKTVLYTTHQMAEAQAICDDVAILLRGKVAMVGKPRELIDSMATQARVVSIEARGISLGEARSVLEDLGCFQDTAISTSNSALPGLCIRASIFPGATSLTRVLTVLESVGAQVLSFKVEEPTLEDVFVKVAQGGD